MSDTCAELEAIAASATLRGLRGGRITRHVLPHEEVHDDGLQHDT